MKSIRWTFPLLSSLSLLPTAALQADRANFPNVILIVGDDVGYGDISCYGSKTIRTPNIDAVASKGILFSDAHSTSATSTPSRFGLFTGCYPWRYQGTGIAKGDAGMIISPDRYTMADMFSQAGYKTGAIGKWHLGIGVESEQEWNSVITPGLADIGFQYSFIMAATGDRVPCVFIEDSKVYHYDSTAPIAVSYVTNFEGEPTGKDNPELVYKLKPSLNHGHDQSIVNGISRIGYMKGGGSALWKDEDIADIITGKTIEFIESHHKEPFFLYFGTNDIHVPRVPHERFVGSSGMGARGDAILSLDYSVGLVMNKIKELGIEDNTIIVITSDNGPVVDDGYNDRAVELLGAHQPWGDFKSWAGKYSSYESAHRIPLIIQWPAKILQPKVSNALVGHIDLLASFATVVGQKLPKSVLDSQPKLDTFLGRDTKGREWLVSQNLYDNLSISKDGWCYIPASEFPEYQEITRTDLGNRAVDQLYNIKADPKQMTNVAAQNPKKIKVLSRLLQQVKQR